MKHTLLALLTLLSALSLPAQNTTADTLQAKSRLLNMVVVTATRTPKLIMEVPVVTRVITEQDIKAADASSVQELLQTELPGIEFSYAMNQQVSLNMQGFGGNSVLFLVDGERLAGETLDNIDYSRLSLDAVQRIEIIKGAASSLYGSNAVGGVVNIITHTPEKPWSLNLGARTSSLGEGHYNGTLGIANGRWNSLSELQFKHADAVHLADTGDLRTIFAHRSFNAKEKVRFKASDRLVFTGRAGYFFRQREKSSEASDRYRDFSAGIKGDLDLGTESDLMMSYAFDQYDKSDYATASGLDVRNYSNVQHTFRSLFNHSFLTHSDTSAVLGTLTLGGDVMRDYLMSYQFTDGSHTQYTADAFAQWDWQPTSRLNIVAALRYDYYSEASASHLSPKINLLYRCSETNLRASYANGFRAPTLKEMYMNFDMANIFIIYGNPDLRSEVSDNFNASVEWSHSHYNLTCMAFLNHVSNRITTFWNQERNGMLYSNMRPLNITGLDLSASARWDNGLGVRLSYIFSHESLTDGGMRASSTRPHSATLHIDYTRQWSWGRTTLALNGRVLSAVTCDEYTSYSNPTQTEEITYPGYTLWRLTLGHRFDGGWALAVTVDNLFDYRPDYYYSNSPATIGRTLSVGLSLDVDQCFGDGKEK